MDTVIDTVYKVAKAASNIIHFIAFQLGHEIDSTTTVSAIVSLIALYFTLITIYRTATYAIRTIFWLVEWALIFYVLAGSFGFLVTRGQSFTMRPLLEIAFAYLLRALGWAAVPQVTVDPNNGIRVNGVPVDIPEDYHQYGDAWRKFKRRSSSQGGRGKQLSRSIFDPFDSAKNRKSKSNKSPYGGGANGLADFLFGEGQGGDAIQSVESIQRGVAESLEAVKRALGVSADPQSGQQPPQDQGWASWWPFQGSGDDDRGSSNSR